MGNYQISVILPVYNVSQYIDEAFSSLLQQTIGFESLQVIFADDCSTDDSGAKIDRYAAKYENVLAIHLEKHSGGPGRPRNTALGKVEAPYVMFLDPDDAYKPEACQFLLDKMEASNADVAGGDHSAIDEDGRVIYDRWPDAKELGETHFLLPEDLDAAVRYRGSFGSKIYRTEFLRCNGILFSEDIIGEDLVFYCSCLSRARKIEFYPVVTYVYRIRSKKNPSITYAFSSDYFMKAAECYRRCRDIFETVCGAPSAFIALCYWMLEDYTLKMIDSTLPVQELLPVLKEWQWLFLFLSDKKCVSLFSTLISPLIQKGDLYAAASTLHSLRPLRKYSLELEAGKQWLSKKADWQEKELTELHDWTGQLQSAKQYLEQQLTLKDTLLVEFQDWIAQLTEAKTWLEEQLTSKDTLLTELQDWNIQLTEAKAWLEQQLASKDEILTELQGWNTQLTEARGWLEEQLTSKDMLLTELRNWNAQLTETKAWLEQQLTSKCGFLTELRDWNSQLTEAKTWLEQQLASKDGLLTELQDWNTQLTEAKTWLEQQGKNKDELMTELSADLDRERNLCQTLRQENEMQALTISKLSFKLNLLLADAKVQKVIQKKGYEI